MRKFKFLFFLPLLFCTSLQATELYTTAVQKGLSDMLNPSGKFDIIYMADGTSFDTAPGGSGATAFSALMGSASASQLPSTLELPATTTVISGISATGRWYNLQMLSTPYTMGTITIVGGTSSASSALSPAANAFDGTTTTFWESSGGAFPQWIQYQFASQQLISTITINNYTDEFGTFTIKASNDGSTFYSLGSYLFGTSTDNTPLTYPTATSTTYKYWRLNCESNPYRGDTYSGVREVQFYSPGLSYNYNSIQYIPPGTTSPKLQIVDDGTYTTSVYFLADVTTLLAGAGTITAVTGTATSYAGWFAGAVRATAFNVASTEKIKENIRDIKIKPDLLDAEAEAKENYITTQKSVWISDNINNYIRVGAGTPHGTITTHVDKVLMERAYSSYVELAWASDLNRNALIEDIQKKHEAVFWQEFKSIRPRQWNPKENLNLTREGFVVEESPDGIKGDDKQSIDPMKIITKQQKALQAMLAAIERLGGTITTTP